MIEFRGELNEQTLQYAKKTFRSPKSVLRRFAKGMFMPLLFVICTLPATLVLWKYMWWVQYVYIGCFAIVMLAFIVSFFIQIKFSANYSIDESRIVIPQKTKMEKEVIIKISTVSQVEKHNDFYVVKFKFSLSNPDCIYLQTDLMIQGTVKQLEGIFADKIVLSRD